MPPPGVKFAVSMTDRIQDLSPTDRRASLTAIILHMLGVGFLIGLMMPLTALVLESWGTSATLIGIVAAMPALAIVLLMPIGPRLMARWGTIKPMLAGLAVGGLALALLPLLPNVPAWIVLRFVIGAAFALPWLVGETWINSLASEETRGRIIGLYAATVFFGFMLGPLTLEWIGIEGRMPFLVAIGALLLSIVPLLFARRLAPRIQFEVSIPVSRILAAAPMVLGAALLAGYTEAALFGLLPVYSVHAGLPQDLSLRLLAIFLVGGLVLQYPLGWLADRSDRRLLLTVTAVIAGAAVAAMPALVGSFVLLALAAFVAGGAALGFYSLGLALLGQRFRPAELAVANAAFILLYESGSILGPAVGGFAMDLADPHGLIVAVALGCAVFAAIGLWRLLADGLARKAP
ncbi:MAG: MFS transporter [Kiloniellales bacterium]